MWYANFKKSLCSILSFSHQETQDGVVNWATEIEVLDPSLPRTTKGPWEKSLTCHGPQFLQFEKWGWGLAKLYSYSTPTSASNF